MSVGAHESILHDLFGLSIVAQHGKGDAEEPLRVAADEDAERIHVAAAYSSNDFRIGDFAVGQLGRRTQDHFSVHGPNVEWPPRARVTTMQICWSTGFTSA